MDIGALVEVLVADLLVTGEHGGLVIDFGASRHDLLLTRCPDRYASIENQHSWNRPSVRIVHPDRINGVSRACHCTCESDFGRLCCKDVEPSALQIEGACTFMWKDNHTEAPG